MREREYILVGTKSGGGLGMVEGSQGASVDVSIKVAEAIESRRYQ